MNKKIRKFNNKYGFVELSFNHETKLYEIEYDNEVENVFNTKKKLEDAKNMYQKFVEELKSFEK